MFISKNYQAKILVASILVSQTFAIVPLAASAAPIRVAGQQVFNVTTGGAARVSTIQKNLDNALVATTNRSPSSVGVVYVKGQPVITLGGFYVTTVDAATAKANATTPALLAQKWANGIKSVLKNQSSVDSYVAQITGSGSSTVAASTTTTSAGSYPYYKQGRIVYIPAGMMIPVAITSGISSQTARPGDRIQAEIAETVNLGDATIPKGSTVFGQVTESTPGAKMGKSGMLGIKFDSIRTADGQDVPITAHIVGGIGKYEEVAAGTNMVKGETTKTKVEQALIRGGIGAGGGAVLGTTIGAIAGHHGAGRGAVAGTVIGGALGVAESLLLRKGSDVQVQQGQALNLQLDAPASLAITQSSGQM